MKFIALVLLAGSLGAQTKKPAQIILTPAQAAYPANSWVRPCGPDNHDDACVEDKTKPTEKPPIKTEVGPICDDAHPCFTFAPAAPPLATWADALKDGVYTATFTDPNNHWRCVVSGTVGEGTLDGIQAFTVICYDMSKTTVPPPAPTK